MHAKSMLTTATNLQNTYTSRLHHGDLKHAVLIGSDLTPFFSKSHGHILAIIYHFSKWLEVITLKDVKSSNIVKFIKKKSRNLPVWCFSKDNA